MNTSFEVDVRNFQRAAAKFAVLKNKSDADVVNKAMKYWLPFAAARLSNATKHATPSNIRMELKGKASRISNKTVGRNRQLRNTLAAAIVAARWRDKGVRAFAKKTRGKRAWISKASIDFFYSDVEKLINAKVRSLNYLRAGFIPAFRQFEIPRQKLKASGHTRFKNRSIGKKAVPSLTGTIEAFTRNAREGAYKLTPNAFRDALPEVTRQFIKWMDQDTVQQGRKSGFY